MYDRDVEFIQYYLGWDGFAKALKDDLNRAQQCDDSLKFTQAILCKRVGPEVWESMKSWFEINKVYCDCSALSVVANIAKDWGNLPTLADAVILEKKPELN